MYKYREYFEAEMRSLQELAQEFSNAYPEQAKMLSLNTVNDRDPYVERLLEGTAFLTAQVRQRIEDSVPEISETLLDQLCPALIRSYPSTAILEFDANMLLVEPVTLSSDEIFTALKVGPEVATCEFTIKSDITVNPIVIEAASVEERVEGGAHISLTLKKSAKALWADLLQQPLSFFLNGDRTLTYALYHALTTSKEYILTHGNRQTRCSSPELKFSGANLNSEASVLPQTGRGHAAFSLLHDYFCAREKYMFVELEGLTNIELDDTKDTIELKIVSDVSMPVEHKFSVQNIRLHCIQTVNLFEAESRPIKFDHTQSHMTVLPDRHAEVTEVYSVNGMSSRDQVTGQTLPYYPLYARPNKTGTERTYYCSKKKTPTENTQVSVHVNSCSPFHSEVLSVDIAATNAQYPRMYMDTNTITSGCSIKEMAFTNITRPSKYLNAPQAHDYPWQLISAINATVSSLANERELKQLLSLFNWSELAESQNKIDAIQKVRAEVFSQFEKGILIQGLSVQINVDEEGFGSDSDIYFFGTILHAFFTAFTSINEQVKTKVVALPSYKEWVWKPMLGNRMHF